MGDVIQLRARYHGKLVDCGTQLLAAGITVLMDRCAMPKDMILALTDALIDARGGEEVHPKGSRECQRLGRVPCSGCDS